MRLPLKPHPDSPCAAVAKIEVEVGRPRADRLELSYVVTGKIADVRMPAAVAASRGDKLWQHTCFEMFVRASSGDGYYEFNFSPSTQWAAYRFIDYRSGMCVATEVDAPPIDIRSHLESFTLQTVLALDRL